MKNSIVLLIVSAFAIFFVQPANADCPQSLLWTNGVVWAYQSAECKKDNKACKAYPDGFVLFYNHAVGSTGCAGNGSNCACSLSDADNDYLYKAIMKAGQQPGAFKGAPNKRVTTNGTGSFIDDFDVGVDGSEKFYQCIEFRIKPDPAGPFKNMRIAIELSQKPDGSQLHGVNAKYDNKDNPTKLIRKVNDKDLEYLILRAGKISVP